jgi:hypothetical protein
MSSSSSQRIDFIGSPRLILPMEVNRPADQPMEVQEGSTVVTNPVRPAGISFIGFNCEPPKKRTHEQVEPELCDVCRLPLIGSYMNRCFKHDERERKRFKNSYPAKEGWRAILESPESYWGEVQFQTNRLLAIMYAQWLETSTDRDSHTYMSDNVRRSMLAGREYFEDHALSHLFEMQQEQNRFGGFIPVSVTDHQQARAASVVKHITSTLQTALLGLGWTK